MQQYTVLFTSAYGYGEYACCVGKFDTYTQAWDAAQRAAHVVFKEYYAGDAERGNLLVQRDVTDFVTLSDEFSFSVLAIPQAPLPQQVSVCLETGYSGTFLLARVHNAAALGSWDSMRVALAQDRALLECC